MIESVIEKTERMDTATTTILVVEDNRDLNDMMCLILQDSGYSTLSSVTGREAMEIMRESRPDLVLLDYMLPDTDAHEIFRKINIDPELKGIPMIIVSARGDMQTKMSSYLAGARRYITKPFESDELVAEVKRTLDQLNRSKENHKEDADPV